MPQHSSKTDTVIDLSAPCLLRVPEVARLLGVTHDTVRRRVQNGRIPVKPRSVRPYEWASSDWAKWFQAK